MAAEKLLPVHNYSADYIFWSFGIIELFLSQFGKRVPLNPVRGLRGGALAVLNHYVTDT